MNGVMSRVGALALLAGLMSWGGNATAQVRSTAGLDAFGYELSVSSAQPATCPYSPLVFDGSAIALFESGADDASEHLLLPEVMPWYGEQADILTVSSNGYVAFDINGVGFEGDDGADFSPDFPLPAVPDNTNVAKGRFYVAHADWATSGASLVRAAYYPSCPREPASGACSAVEWRDVVVSGGAATATFQAVLYHATGRLVAQHLALPAQGDVPSITVGLQQLELPSGMARYGDVFLPAAGQAVCWTAPGGAPATVSVSASASPAQGGSVTGGGTYGMGEPVTMTATANQGFVFGAWLENGNPVSTDNPYLFAASANRVLVARFDPTVNITASVLPVSSGSVTGAGAHVVGSTVNLVASPAQGFAFVHWEEQGVTVSLDAAYSFTASQGRDMVAVFEIYADPLFSDGSGFE